MLREEVIATQPLSEERTAAYHPHLYYPAEGFGNMYRRVMTNDFFTDLIRRTHIHTVAEVPLDSYGIVGAGNLILTQLGCETTLISDDQHVLDRAAALMEFNGAPPVRYLHSSFDHIPVEDNTFDLTWSFDRLQTLPDPGAFLRELCRISKATLVSVPNAHNYGQYAHYVYHRVTGTTCEYVGPRQWMLRAPLRRALQQGGMMIVDEGVIDVPWWPGFPELPNLVRQLLRRPPVAIDQQTMSEHDPAVVSPQNVPQLRRKAERAGFIERGRWPAWIKLLFAHNVYVIGCKPRFRQQLGL